MNWIRLPYDSLNRYNPAEEIPLPDFSAFGDEITQIFPIASIANTAIQ